MSQTATVETADRSRDSTEGTAAIPGLRPEISRFLHAGKSADNEAMVETLGVFLATAVVLSLGVIAAYVIGLVVVSVVTACRRARPDPLREDLDRILDEILGRRDRVTSAVLPSPHGAYRR